MFELIEEILLSQFVIFSLLAILLLLVTRWALRTREYAAYALGWLAGILLIIIIGAIATNTDSNNEDTVQGDPPVAIEANADAEEEDAPPVSVAAVVIPAFIGLFAGYGVMFFMEQAGGTHTRRAITIAGSTVLLLLMMYFVLGLSEDASRWIGVFSLAAGVGALFNIVLDGTTIPTRLPYDDAVAQAQARSLNPMDNQGDGRRGPSPSPFGEARRGPPDRRR